MRLRSNRILDSTAMALVLVVMAGVSAPPSLWAADSVRSSAVPSDANPGAGEGIAVGVTIDTLGVPAPACLLVRYEGTLSWDPAVQSYVGHRGPLAGFTGSVTVDGAAGEIGFEGSQDAGGLGRMLVLEVTYEVVGSESESSLLDLDYTVMENALADDLLPILTVSDGQVTVLSP